MSGCANKCLRSHGSGDVSIDCAPIVRRSEPSQNLLQTYRGMTLGVPNVQYHETQRRPLLKVIPRKYNKSKGNPSKQEPYAQILPPRCAYFQLQFTKLLCSTFLHVLLQNANEQDRNVGLLSAFPLKNTLLVDRVKEWRRSLYFASVFFCLFLLKCATALT